MWGGGECGRGGGLVRVWISFISSPGPDFICLETGSGFIDIVRVRILSVVSPCPGPALAPDFIHYDSGFCSGPAPDFIDLSPCPEFIKQVRVRVRVRILFISSPDPDFIYLESGSGFIDVVRSGFCKLGVRVQDRVRLRILSITSPDFVLVRIRILSIFESVSESEIYQASRVRVRVRILSISSPGPGPDLLSMSGYASGFYQHPDDKAKTVLPEFTSAVSLLSYNSRFVNWCQHVSRIVPLTFSVNWTWNIQRLWT